MGKKQLIEKQTSMNSYDTLSRRIDSYIQQSKRLNVQLDKLEQDESIPKEDLRQAIRDSRAALEALRGTGEALIDQAHETLQRTHLSFFEYVKFIGGFSTIALSASFFGVINQLTNPWALVSFAISMALFIWLIISAAHIGFLITFAVSQRNCSTDYLTPIARLRTVFQLAVLILGIAAFWIITQKLVTTLEPPLEFRISVGL